MDLSNFLVNPVTLALIVLGVVEFIKKFGITGNKLMLIAMAVGIFFAVLYKTREFYLPAQPYIDVFFFGIAVGLGASGIYSFVNDRFPPHQKLTLKYTKVEKSGSPTKEEELP
jgi:4-hydroxybenzoate polyprenyltransferase